MPWIRLSDDYNDHPKFDHLSDGAFRLWHQGMGFCRKYKTDGLIPLATVRGFKAYSPKRMRELMTPWKEGENPLWHDRGEGWGVVVHDYLEWNPSKDEENERREETKERMRVIRERRSARGVAPDVTPVVRAHTPHHIERTNANVLGREGIQELPEEEKERSIEQRAAAFLERYPQIYAEFRSGAHYHVKEARDFPAAVELARGWPDDTRLDAMFKVFLHLKGRDVLNRPGTPRQFLHHAPECDQLLRQNGR